MYIFLDESYNLKNRTKPQFISINGFESREVKKVWKRWKIYRRSFVGKARIHATDRKFEPLRQRALQLIFSTDSKLLTAFQLIQAIPVKKFSPYYQKGKLNFEKVYEELLKALLDKLNLQEYKKVTITIDSRKHKKGILGKKEFQENILSFLKEYYPGTIFQFIPQPSHSNILLEIADFISNSFYKSYLGQKVSALEKLKSKTITIKNPLEKPRG